MALHSSMIHGVQVPGFRYVVFGEKRGYISTHRTKRAANRSLAEDARKCMIAGTPSDAMIYRWRDCWVWIEEPFDVELVKMPDE
jgi:hypothetical protein